MSFKISVLNSSYLNDFYQSGIENETFKLPHLFIYSNDLK